ncbi:MAG: glutaredoxin domain-containing protein [archaeon]
MKVIVYSIPMCYECSQLKDWLKEHNVEFETIDVAVDQAARKEVIEVSGQRTVPVTKVDDEIIIGFEREALKKALKLGG